MLIALGRPSSSLLTFLTRPESTSNRLWPLATSVAAARQAAGRDLSPEVKRRVTSPDSSLLDVVDALGSTGSTGGGTGAGGSSGG